MRLLGLRRRIVPIGEWWRVVVVDREPRRREWVTRLLYSVHVRCVENNNCESESKQKEQGLEPRNSLTHDGAAQTMWLI